MLGQSSGRIGRFDEAEAELLQSEAIFRGLGNLDGAASVVESLAELAFRRWDIALAASALGEGPRARLAHAGNRRGVIYHLEGCAKITAVNGKPAVALRCLAAAQQLRNSGGWVLPEPERAALEQVVLSSAATLSEVGSSRGLERRAAPINSPTSCDWLWSSCTTWSWRGLPQLSHRRRHDRGHLFRRRNHRHRSGLGDAGQRRRRLRHQFIHRTGALGPDRSRCGRERRRPSDLRGGEVPGRGGYPVARESNRARRCSAFRRIFAALSADTVESPGSNLSIKSARLIKTARGSSPQRIRYCW